MSTPSTADYEAGEEWWVRRIITSGWREVNARERELWVLVVGALFVDFGLTLYGLQLGLVERNPLARSLITAYGFPAVLVLKGGALAIAAILRTLLPEAYGAMVPLALAISWGYAVAVNISLILPMLV